MSISSVDSLHVDISLMETFPSSFFNFIEKSEKSLKILKIVLKEFFGSKNKEGNLGEK